jgi:hypothetical protein
MISLSVIMLFQLAILLDAGSEKNDEHEQQQPQE